MNRYIVYSAVALLLAACAPGPQQTELEPVTPATPSAPLPEEPSVSVVPGIASGGIVSGGTASGGAAVMSMMPGTASGGAATVGVTPSTASGGAATGEAASPDPQGEISISTDNSTFVTSGSGEANPITVPAGSIFYLKLNFTDPDGITEAQIDLRNSEDAGILPAGPFTIASTDCDSAVASAPTELNCTFAVNVAADAQDINQPGETAYAFRPLVTDGQGNGGLAFSWAYLNITPQ